jgi:hypothetical protein
VLRKNVHSGRKLPGRSTDRHRHSQTDTNIKTNAKEHTWMRSILGETPNPLHNGTRTQGHEDKGRREYGHEVCLFVLGETPNPLTQQHKDIGARGLRQNMRDGNDTMRDRKAFGETESRESGTF